jgi:hypothetical protein
MKGKGRSRRQAVLDRLLAEPGCWISAQELSRISLQYCARIKENRQLGFVIENRTEHVDGKTHGFYRIRLGMPRHVIPTKPQSQPQARLFDDAPEPKYEYPD